MWSDDDIEAAPRQDPPAMPTHHREETPITPARQLRSQHQDESDFVEVRVPAWVLQFSQISINITPHSISAPPPIPNTPSPTRRSGPEPPIVVFNTPSPTRRPGSRTQNVISESSSSTTSTTQQRPSPLRTTTMTNQLVPPRPIYPPQPGEPAPLINRTFDQRRTHAYYVVFVGVTLGIYHEYWSVRYFLIICQVINLFTQVGP